MLAHFHLPGKSQNFVIKISFHEVSLENFLRFLYRSLCSKINFFHLLFSARYFRYGFLNLFKRIDIKSVFENIHIHVTAMLTLIWTQWDIPLWILIIESFDLLMDFLSILIFYCIFILLKLNQVLNKYGSNN